MQTFRVAKRPLRSNKNWNLRRIEIADAISTRENEAMVACTKCVENGDVCYYDREQSVKCAACLRHQRECDGTFALEEFRKVADEKKRIKQRSLLKQRELARLEAESEDLELKESVARLDEISSRMLKREMQALGVLEQTPKGHEVAAGDPSFVWEGVPVGQSID